MANACTSSAYPCVQTEPPGYTCQGQFADWPMPDSWPGAKVAPSYDTSTAGIVVDRVTGLIWQRALPATYAGCTGQRTSGQGQVGEVCSWSAAKQYCAALVLAGQSDWRLPSKIEIESLVDYTQSNTSHINAAFQPQSAQDFWSASPYADVANAPGNAWYMTSARSEVAVTTASYSVRCVRSERGRSTSPTGHYVVNTAADTVTDSRTGLVWELTTNVSTYTWDSAQAHCGGLGGGWRLPTENELLTLVDPTRVSPSIDPSFANTLQESYWSSTVWQDESIPFGAWGVRFREGTYFLNFDRTSPWRVRCVR
jgi:Protein of unknown function (DUF1566)